MFNSHSQVKEFQIRFQLTNLSKGEQPIIDILAATGAPLFEKDYVTYLLNGLGPAYESYITSMTTQSDPVTATELYHLLLIHESRLSHAFRNTNFPFKPLVNFTNIFDPKDQCGRIPSQGGRNNRGHGQFTPSRGRSSYNNCISPPNTSPKPTFVKFASNLITWLSNATIGSTMLTNLNHSLLFRPTSPLSHPPQASQGTQILLPHTTSLKTFSSSIYPRNHIVDMSKFELIMETGYPYIISDKHTKNLLISGPLHDGLY